MDESVDVVWGGGGIVVFAGLREEDVGIRGRIRRC